MTSYAPGARAEGLKTNRVRRSVTGATILAATDPAAPGRSPARVSVATSTWVWNGAANRTRHGGPVMRHLFYMAGQENEYERRE